MEKGNEVDESTKTELEKLLTNTDQEPVESGENQCDASLPSPVVADTTNEVPIVEKQSEENDIVMLSDDEIGKQKT